MKQRVLQDKPWLVQLCCVFLPPLPLLHRLLHLDHHCCDTLICRTYLPRLRSGLIQFTLDSNSSEADTQTSGREVLAQVLRVGLTASAHRLCHFQTHPSQPDTVLSGKLSWVPNRIHRLLSLLSISYPWIEGEHNRKKIQGHLGICEEEYVRFLFNAWPLETGSWKSLLAAIHAIYSSARKASEIIRCDFFLVQFTYHSFPCLISVC